MLLSTTGPGLGTVGRGRGDPSVGFGSAGFEAHSCTTRVGGLGRACTGPAATTLGADPISSRPRLGCRLTGGGVLRERLICRWRCGGGTGLGFSRVICAKYACCSGDASIWEDLGVTDSGVGAMISSVFWRERGFDSVFLPNNPRSRALFPSNDGSSVSEESCRRGSGKPDTESAILLARL